jgi:hypothetical protein
MTASGNMTASVPRARMNLACPRVGAAGRKIRVAKARRMSESGLAYPGGAVGIRLDVKIILSGRARNRPRRLLLLRARPSGDYFAFAAPLGRRLSANRFRGKADLCGLF